MPMLVLVSLALAGPPGRPALPKRLPEGAVATLAPHSQLESSWRGEPVSVSSGLQHMTVTVTAHDAARVTVGTPGGLLDELAALGIPITVSVDALVPALTRPLDLAVPSGEALRAYAGATVHAGPEGWRLDGWEVPVPADAVALIRRPDPRLPAAEGIVPVDLTPALRAASDPKQERWLNARADPDAPGFLWVRWGRAELHVATTTTPLLPRVAPPPDRPLPDSLQAPAGTTATYADGSPAGVLLRAVPVRMEEVRACSVRGLCVPAHQLVTADPDLGAPEPIHRERPEMPQPAPAGVGRCIVSLIVDRDGSVLSVAPHRCAPEYFPNAEAAAQRYTFQPARDEEGWFPARFDVLFVFIP